MQNIEFGLFWMNRIDYRALTCDLKQTRQNFGQKKEKQINLKEKK